MGTAGHGPVAGVLNTAARFAAERSAGRIGKPGLLIDVPGDKPLRWRGPWEFREKKPSGASGPPQLPPKIFCFTDGPLLAAGFWENLFPFGQSLSKKSLKSP